LCALGMVLSCFTKDGEYFGCCYFQVKVVEAVSQS
jgi:hypothetical protein